MEEIKQMARATWDAGNFAEIAPHIADVGDRVVAEAAIEPGMRVLDVACGTGSCALPAARAGATATGLDIVPKLLDAGRAIAAAEGLEITWVEGDAEELPFEDDSFERVLSTFGHMFAPRHQKCADEMARVCAPGGQIVTATWDPEGNVGTFFKMTSAYAPPSDFASSPLLWGEAEHVREMFGEAASDISFEPGVTVVEWEDSAESFADYFIENFGPLVMAKQNLGETFGEIREKMLALYAEQNQATDGGLRFPQQYLISKVVL